MFEKSVLRKMFGYWGGGGSKGGRRKLRDVILCESCSSPKFVSVFKSRSMRWAGNVARVEVKRNAYKILVGKPDGKRALGRLRRRIGE